MRGRLVYAIRSYDSLLSQLRDRPGDGGLQLIAIDGCGGAGKSTLARRIAQRSGSTQVVPMDDFYKPSSARSSGEDGSPIGAAFDWKRLEREVLQPLSTGVPARYQRYDWDTDALADWHEVSPTSLVIVEGVYSSRLEMAAYYSLIVWVEAPAAERLRRGIARDGEASRAQWEQEWMPAEERYVRAHGPRQRADVVVDGLGEISHDPDSGVVCVIG